MGATVSVLNGKVATNETNIFTLTEKVSTLETSTTNLEEDIKDLKENGVQQPKTEKSLDMSTDEEGRIINIRTYYEDDTYDDTAVEWNTSGYISKLGELTISWDY